MASKKNYEPARWKIVCLVLATVMATTPLWAAPTLTLSTAPGGAPVSGTYALDLGAGNGLAAGSPSPGVQAFQVGSSGAIYASPYNLTVSGAQPSWDVTAYVATQFGAFPLRVVESCPTAMSCSNSASYSQMSNNPASPTPITSSSMANNSTVSAYIGAFLPLGNGLNGQSGQDSATITFTARDTARTLSVSVTLTLSISSGSAVRLLLSGAPGGLNMNTASDYAMNYGAVNGLGISPAPGLTVSSAPGGVIYSTPYQITPSFSGFATSTGTVTTYVSMDFAHPIILQLQDSASSAGPYAAISKTAGTPTVFNTAAGSDSLITRYLGLFVSNANGPLAFSGADNATATYTLTVP